MRARKDCVDISREYNVKSDNLAKEHVTKIYVPKTVRDTWDPNIKRHSYCPVTWAVHLRCRLRKISILF